MIKSNPNGDLAAELTMLMSQRIAELEAEKTTLEHQVMRDGIAASNRTQRLVDRVNELEAENERLNTLLHKASQKSAEDFAEYVEEARMQAARDCIDEMEGYPTSVSVHVTSHDAKIARETKQALIAAIKAHFGIKGE